MNNQKNLEDTVRDSLEAYFKDLGGVEPTAMYDMILGVVERPLLVDQVGVLGQRRSWGREPGNGRS